jgi:hypothetical protein
VTCPAGQFVSHDDDGNQVCIKCSIGTAGTAKDPTQCTCKKGYSDFRPYDGACKPGECVPPHCVALTMARLLHSRLEPRIKLAALLSDTALATTHHPVLWQLLVMAYCVWWVVLDCRHAGSVCCFSCAAGSGTACDANQFVDGQGYCVACGNGTAGVDPKDRNMCLCKSGWGFFSDYGDTAFCSKLSRQLCFPLSVAMLLAGARAGRHGASAGRLA